MPYIYLRRSPIILRGIQGVSILEFSGAITQSLTRGITQFCQPISRRGQGVLSEINPRKSDIIVY